MEQVLELQNVCWTRRVKIIELDAVINAIRAIVDDWQATETDLIRTQTSVGLLLADLVQYLGVSGDLARDALGADLYDQLAERGLL